MASMMSLDYMQKEKLKPTKKEHTVKHHLQSLGSKNYPVPNLKAVAAANRKNAFGAFLGMIVDNKEKGKSVCDPLTGSSIATFPFKMDVHFHASKTSEDNLEAGPTLDGQKFASIQELLDNSSFKELSQA